MTRFSKLLLLVGFMPVLGCRRDTIQTYEIPKETAPAMEIGSVAEGASKEIEWKVPAGWKEQAPSSMRVGSFLVKGENGQEADMSVVPLSGAAGGDLANINRWRGQINLHSLSKADFAAQSETISVGGRKMLYVDFVSRDLLVQQRYKKRLIAAIYHPQGSGSTLDGRTWFFKMMGEDATVLSAKPAFMKFLRSLKFNEPKN